MKEDRTITVSKSMIKKSLKKKKELSCHKCGKHFYLGDVVKTKKNPKGRYYCQECFKILYIDPLISDEELAKEEEELKTYFLEMKDNPIELEKHSLIRSKVNCSICNKSIESRTIFYRGKKEHHAFNVCPTCVNGLPKDQYVILED